MSKVATKVLDLDNASVEFTFEGSEAPVVVKLGDFSEDMQLQFALYGISQKLGDSYSGSKGDSVKAYELFNGTLTELSAGNWRASRGEGEAKPRTTELAEAIARIQSRPLADVTAALAAASDDQRKTLRSNERVKATIAVIRAEKAQARMEKLGDVAEDLGI